MSELKVTSKISVKPYACADCGYAREFETNHWGEVYNTRCQGCSGYPVWICQQPVPEGFKKPEPWKIVKLGDIMKVV